MKRYHAVTLEAENPKAYKPMDPKEKAEKVKRLEMRLAGKVVLDDSGNLLSYGEIATPAPIAFDDSSAIDDAKLDIWSTEKCKIRLPEPVQDAGETNVLPDVQSGQQPVVSQQEFEERLEKLYQQSEAFHKQFMEKFGDK